MKEAKYMLLLAQSLIGTGFFLLYIQHVRYIFESRTNIQHITQLEREALIRREDALYYSFYKTITEESNFWAGYAKLKNVTNIEYPRQVNVIQRFKILPELIIGYAYHLVRGIASNGYVPLFSCWDLNDVRIPHEHGRQCDIRALPMQFYLEFVWILGGLTVLVLYMYGSLLSENIFGGIYAVISYVMFHSHASKIYERPMARENFAFPIIFLQIFYLCMCIERITVTKEYRYRLFVIIKFSILTAMSLLTWQFSSIIFATQIMIMMIPWSTNTASLTLSTKFTSDFALSQLLGNGIAFILSNYNKQYVFSWQLGPSISLIMSSEVRRLRPQETSSDAFSIKTVALGFLGATSFQGTIIDFLDKIGVLKPVDNSFLLYRDLIVHWLLQAKLNFVTNMAACNPAYKRVHLTEIWELIKTLIVKPYCMYGVVMLAMFFRKWRKSSECKQSKSNEHIERAKNYVLEDFLEENRISMQDMTTRDTEKELNICYNLLEECDYNYELYKKETMKRKEKKKSELTDFMNDIKNLKAEISELNDKRQSEGDKLPEKVICSIIDNNEVLNIQQSKSPTNKQNNSNDTTNEKVQKGISSFTKSNKHIEENVNMNYFPKNLLKFHYIYSFLQMAVFTIIGLSVKKLFFLSFTEGCVIAPTICSKFWHYKQRNIFWSVSLAVFLLSMFNPGIVNIREEYFPAQYSQSTDDLESMLEWIKVNTERDAVFAGPIEIIGTVHMTTKRPIVNHAHLEMRQIGDRTEHVYSIYGRQQSSDIYNQCSQLKIQYLIISLKECRNTISNDCDLLSIWDNLQPAYWKFPQFCSELLTKNIPSFLKVYTNEYYSVIKMFSQSVQINLKQTKMPEKIM